MLESPLALIDVRSVMPEDMMVLRMEMPSTDPRTKITGTVGYVHVLQHNKSRCLSTEQWCGQSTGSVF